VLAGAGVGVVMMLIVAAVSAVVLRGGDDGAAVGPPATSGRPTTVPAPAAGAFDAVLAEAVAFVERTRGKSFKTPPTVTVLDDEAFVARYQELLDESFEKYRTDYENATAIYQALGILRPGVSYIDAQRAFGTAGVLGFYDPETGELTVRSGEMTPFARLVLVHELTHALDDQWFELHRPEYDDEKDEIAFGLSAVAEGNARRVENAYRATLSASERRSAEREEAGYAAGFPLGMFTVSFLQLQLAPYVHGEAFVAQLLSAGGEDAVDEALRSPPRTSAEVMDFRRYAQRVQRVEVRRPPADGPILEEGVVGQIAIQSILEGSLNRSTASAAASGWAGDWFVAWREGDVPCVRLRAVMETPRDLAELRAAFEAWARARSGATVSATTADVTVTSCAR
jgi:hypothetical protein